MWAAKRCGFYGQFWLILLENAVLCCAMFRNCWYPPHMINFPATDWTCTLHIQRISLPHLLSPYVCSLVWCMQYAFVSQFTDYLNEAFIADWSEMRLHYVGPQARIDVYIHLCILDVCAFMCEALKVCVILIYAMFWF